MNSFPPLRWGSPDGRHTVIVTPACWRRLHDTARHHAPREVGASLHGSYSADGFDAWVTGSAPVPRDSHGLGSSFRRGVEGMAKFFAGLNRATAGREHYLGEWHSHPCGVPWPSPQDDQTQAAIASDPVTACPEVILIIVGEKPRGTPAMAVFVYSRSCGRILLESIDGNVPD